MSDAARYAQLLARFAPSCQLLRHWPLTGGVSAQVTALTYTCADGSAHKVVVRQHGSADLARDPQIASHEFRLLQALRAADLPVPAPIFVDEAESILGAPVLVVSFVEGDVVLSPPDPVQRAEALADVLAQLHAIDILRAGLDFLSTTTAEIPPRPSHLDASLSENVIRDALDRSTPPPICPAVLLHGDFWPGNVLWRAGQLAAVLDWEDAALGDPLADVANARLELLWSYGLEAMDAFTERYFAQTACDTSALPYWDLRAALRPAGKLDTWGLDAATEAHMRALHLRFVQHALDSLHSVV